MKHDHGARTFLTSFLVGTAVGAIAALLLAPSSGGQLRRKLTREGRRRAEQASDVAEAMLGEAADAYERVRELAG